jgi:predicted short-subunit dehydrogenase-like oxidoreductase (DUF2520 family)
MPVRIAIVGPGRVGQAFARQFAASGASVLGFVGRDGARTRAAVAALGTGRALACSDLVAAHVVVFAVGDGELEAAVAAAAAAGGRRCCLWLHTSGRHDLSVFAHSAALGVRPGSLHPVAPFPDADTGRVLMRGAPAVLAGPANSMRLLRRLTALLGLEPIECGEQDRALYHAACALAANGSTALFALAQEAFAAAGGLDARDGARLVAALMASALEATARLGPGPALSGPVRRGDADTIAVHIEALVRGLPAALPGYRALMQRALVLAQQQGLPEPLGRPVARALSDPGGSA